MKNAKTLKTEEYMAKLICQYNGQNGTPKQVAKVLKALPTIGLLQNFCFQRKLR